ncbi:MAG: elongation factor Ts [Spirochaetae bacterium HGW-Spirochaetae-8]|nr:MAG: elongation factor Ts [Spirochaetae bacterium HGW-Spirochaetae-8]
MEITADIVKKLRDATGAGMMDCKKALVKAEGDFAQAEKLLKEMGLAAVAKRSGRATNNGRVFTLVQADKAVILEMACETDFVARNADFVKLGNELCQDVLSKGYTAVAPELEVKVQELISTIKENMALKRFQLVAIPQNAMVAQYVHGEGSLGVLVLVQADKADALQNDKVKEFAFDCALHIAAFTPRYLSSKVVDAAYIKEQTEIFTAQTLALGKPEKVVPGIVQGKLNKHYSEICFLQQPFVKDDTRSVEKVMSDLSKETGANLSIPSYTFYRVGVEE